MTEYIDLDTPLELYVGHGGFCKKQISTLRDLLDTNSIPYTVADVVSRKDYEVLEIVCQNFEDALKDTLNELEQSARKQGVRRWLNTLKSNDC